MISFNRKILTPEVLHTFISYLDQEPKVYPSSRPSQYSAQDGNRCSVRQRQSMWPDPHHATLALPPAYSLPQQCLGTSAAPWRNEKVNSSQIKHSVVGDRRLVTLVGGGSHWQWGRNVNMLTERVRGETRTKRKKFLNDRKEEEE